MGFQMLAIIAIFTWAGVKLDERSGNENSIYTAILSVLGVIIGIYTALREFIHKKDDS
ncbi:MAG: AtpZ/AtpI family protein [Bacteroidales bacterium]|nr:AtpZ/AtpI family protein [Bacteroidales bacterium]